jgi:opacity protein-like surface antigen
VINNKNKKKGPTMRLSLLALTISLVLSPVFALADNAQSTTTASSQLNNAMASNPELGSYQSSSLNPAQLPDYQDAAQVAAQQNTAINQTITQVTNVGDGLAVGVQAGVDSSGIATKDVSFSRKDTQNYGLTGPSFGAHVDYGHTFSNQLYLGGEIYGNLTHAGTGNKNGNNSPYVTAYIGDNMGFDILPGYQISPISLIYAKLGLNLAHIGTGGVANQADVFTNSPGADLGVGYRQALTQNLSLALEYDWIAYNAVIYQSSSPLRFAQNIFQLSLNYQLDSLGINNTGSRPALDFDSPYVGINAGRKAQSSTVSSSTVGSTGLTTTWGADGFAEGLKLGYGYQFNSWFYLGTEAFAQLSQGLEPQELGTSNTAEGSSLGLSLLPGYILNQSNLLFGRVGAIRTHFNGYYYGGSPINFDVNKIGLELGLGYETALTQCLSLVAEYDWSIYPSIYYSNGDNTNNFHNYYKFIDQFFSLGLNYRF